MIKKTLLVLFCIIFQVSATMAAVQMKVSAQKEFRTDKPDYNINVKVLKDTELGNYEIPEGAILECKILEIVDPKRGKRNAGFYVKPESYFYNGNNFQIKEDIYGKYSKTVLSKEELKKIPPAKMVKNAALAVGNHFVKGLSLGVSMVEGVIKNEEDNRIKSGVKKVYKDSPLSYVEEGEQLDLKPGDEFYLVFKIDDDEEPNYEYTTGKNED